jgi:hypothetical protein
MKIITVKCRGYSGKSKSFCNNQAADRFILSICGGNTQELIGYSPEKIYLEVLEELVRSGKDELAIKFAKEVFRLDVEETELIGHIME